MPLQLQRHLFTVDQYDRMIRAGVLTENDRVQLIEGEIIEMTPIGSRHAGCVYFLNRNLGRSLANQAIVGTQSPISLSGISEPEPDVLVLKVREDYYRSSHPEPEDIYFLIEVSDTSLEFDRNVKMPMYARAGIAEAWVVDLENNCIEVYSQPSPEGFLNKRVFQYGDTFNLITFPHVSISVDDVLG